MSNVDTTIAMRPDKVQLMRGPSTKVEGLRMIRDEWRYDTDLKRLRCGTDQNRHGEFGTYNGGNHLIWVRVYKASHTELSNTFVRVLPPSRPKVDIDARVLDEGELVHCIEEDWWYIGDGVTLGGNKAK